MKVNLAPSTLNVTCSLITIGIITIFSYYGIVHKHSFVMSGSDTLDSFRTAELRNYLFACTGGSLTLGLTVLANCCGKYLIKEHFDSKYLTEGLLILTILVPGISHLASADEASAGSIFWSMFHVQIMIILSVVFLFWADKMKLMNASPEVVLNVALMCATFTLHVFVPKPSWTTQSTDACNIAYMALYILNMISILQCWRQTYRRSNVCKNEVVLIDTAAAEQQWALSAISAIFIYYLVFLVLEAGVYRGNDRFHLPSGYLSAQYVLLSLLAWAALTLIQREELYHGIMAQASLEIKRVFVRYVSHEIRTPLNTTQLGLDLLGNEVKEGVTDTAVLTDLISDATSSCSIAITILNDLLMYEKIDGGLLTLERAEMPVWSFVESVMKVFLIQAKSCDVELSWPQRSVKGVYAEIDQYKLSQVLRNLISNALKFTPAGGRVRVSAEVLLPGGKPRTARSLSVLRETDEDEDGKDSAAISTVRRTDRRASNRKSRLKVRRSKEFDEIAGLGVSRTLSGASEETPPHQFSFPANSPLYRGAAYSARAALVPEENSETLESAAALTTTPLAAGAALSGMQLQDFETGPAMMAGEEGTTKTLAFTTPAAGNLRGSMDSGDGFGFDADERPSKTQEARDSPESSDQSGSPPDHSKGFFSDKSFEFARKMFSADAPRASLQVFPSVTMVRISVTDSGAGISKENQERLFKEIVQFNAGKLQKGQGSGIGLWISNTIVKLHGGKIGVMSEGEDRGSTFYVDIPISKIERGSNYSHVSPAHTDVSSKNKYNSPVSSPDTRSRKGSSSSIASPLIQTIPAFNPNRHFISPTESEGSTSVPQAGIGTSDRTTRLSGPPLIAFPRTGAGAEGTVRTSLQAPLHPSRLAGAGTEIPLNEIGGSMKFPAHMASRSYSDQSIFTGGSGSNRSCRSRGTIQSSFSTDSDGVSNKTDAVDSVRYPPGGLSSVSESAVESVGADEGARLTINTPFQASSIVTNLFPDSEGELSQQSKRSSKEAAAQKPAPPAEALSPEAARIKTLYGKRALIVDDSPTNRKFVNRLLRTKISTRDEAHDGQQALDMVVASMKAGVPYDVILMDYVMPVMDGPAATELIRKQGFKGLILGVTGNGHQTDIDLFTGAGADRILVKPLSADQFYNTLLEMLT